MNPNAAVRTVMTTEVVHIGPDETIERVRDFFEEHHINHLPVCENDRIIGIISRADYHMLLHSFTVFDTQQSRQYNEETLRRLLVREVMKTEVATINTDATLAEAASIFGENRFHALPVVEGNDQRLVGIITVMDLLNHAYAQ